MGPHRPEVRSPAPPSGRSNCGHSSDVSTGCIREHVSSTRATNRDVERNPMKSISRIGGASAVIAAATFIIGLVMFVTLLIDYTTAETPGEAVAFLVSGT